MNLLIIITIGISLSMDAFGVALALTSSKQKVSYLFAVIVGICHFILSYLGSYISDGLLTNIFLSANILVGIILILIGLNVFLGIKKEQSNKNLNLWSNFILAVSVSLDSFGTGIGIKLINPNMFINAVVFTISSFSFTLLGLIIGKRVNHKYGTIAEVIGGITLILLGIYYIIF